MAVNFITLVCALKELRDSNSIFDLLLKIKGDNVLVFYNFYNEFNTKFKKSGSTDYIRILDECEKKVNADTLDHSMHQTRFFKEHLYS